MQLPVLQGVMLFETNIKYMRTNKYTFSQANKTLPRINRILVRKMYLETTASQVN